MTEPRSRTAGSSPSTDPRQDDAEQVLDLDALRHAIADTLAEHAAVAHAYVFGESVVVVDPDGSTFLVTVAWADVVEANENEARS